VTVVQAPLTFTATFSVRRQASSLGKVGRMLPGAGAPAGWGIRVVDSPTGYRMALRLWTAC